MAATEISSVSELVELVNQQRGSSKNRFYYRGVPSKYKLLPRLLRSSTLEKLTKVHDAPDQVSLQRALLERLNRYVPPYKAGGEPTLPDAPPSYSGDALCTAQHHGLPTLLIDWTLNPLVALYFAASKHEKEPGSLWYMELKPLDDRRDTTVHLEAGQPLTEYTKVPVLVVPRCFTRRIEAQAGRFVYFGNCRDPLDDFADAERRPWLELDCWTISCSKKEICKQLEYYQIHEGTMFPDLDGHARYLAEGGL